MVKGRGCSEEEKRPNSRAEQPGGLLSFEKGLCREANGWKGHNCCIGFDTIGIGYSGFKHSVFSADRGNTNVAIFCCELQLAAEPPSVSGYDRALQHGLQFKVVSTNQLIPSGLTD